jgi:hypothetical protein
VKAAPMAILVEPGSDQGLCRSHTTTSPRPSRGRAGLIGSRWRGKHWLAATHLPPRSPAARTDYPTSVFLPHTHQPDLYGCDNVNTLVCRLPQPHHNVLCRLPQPHHNIASAARGWRAYGGGGGSGSLAGTDLTWQRSALSQNLAIHPVSPLAPGKLPLVLAGHQPGAEQGPADRAAADLGRARLPDQHGPGGSRDVVVGVRSAESDLGDGARQFCAAV